MNNPYTNQEKYIANIYRKLKINDEEKPIIDNYLEQVHAHQKPVPLTPVIELTNADDSTLRNLAIRQLQRYLKGEDAIQVLNHLDDVGDLPGFLKYSDVFFNKIKDLHGLDSDFFLQLWNRFKQELKIESVKSNVPQYTFMTAGDFEKKRDQALKQAQERDLMRSQDERTIMHELRDYRQKRFIQEQQDSIQHNEQEEHELGLRNMSTIRANELRINELNEYKKEQEKFNKKLNRIGEVELKLQNIKKLQEKERKLETINANIYNNLIKLEFKEKRKEKEQFERIINNELLKKQKIIEEAKRIEFELKELERLNPLNRELTLHNPEAVASAHFGSEYNPFMESTENPMENAAHLTQYQPKKFEYNNEIEKLNRMLNRNEITITQYTNELKKLNKAKKEIEMTQPSGRGIRFSYPTQGRR